MISELLMDAKPMLLIIAIAAVIVFLAMMVDLVAGLYKAHLRGDAHRSEALKRTGFKFCLYEGSLLIAAGVDMLVHLSKLYHWFDFRVGEVVYGLPLITIGMGIFWCVVEFLSVREKADEKIHSQISKAEKLAKQMLSKEELIEVISEALKRRKEADNG